jgi:hypothetical protein
MLNTILALLPKVTAAVAALPEFVAHIKAIKATLSEDDQTVLQNAYELAKQGSDAANAELEALVAAKTR